MSQLTLHPTESASAPRDITREIEETRISLDERKAKLTELQEAFLQFKTRYAEVVGSKLAELAELETAIEMAQLKSLGLEPQEKQEEEHREFHAPTEVTPAKTPLRRLFWSVARLFHPDHASDEGEAKRRHAVMAEASRAYREGDFESLQALLGDDELKFYCTTSVEREQSLAEQLWALKDELRTMEFGIRRIVQNPLYRLKLETEEARAQGRDLLVEKADSTQRRIIKARKRLEHFS